MGVDKFLNQEQKNSIVNAISKAELGTSAEIRVHIDSVCLSNPISAAVKVFNNLNMKQTKDRNAVLIYIAYKSNKCAILGDIGIDEKVGADFWDDCYRNMSESFRRGDFSGGIEQAVLHVGDKLKEFFPYQSDDVNELSNEISIGR